MKRALAFIFFQLLENTMPNRSTLAMLLGFGVLLGSWAMNADAAPSGSFPFRHKVELYRDKEGDVMAFSLKLEQPFLAEEFEKSNICAFGLWMAART